MTYQKKYIIIKKKVVKYMKKQLKIITFVTLVIILSFGLYIMIRSDNLKFKDDYMLYNFATYSNNKQIKVNIPTTNNVKYLKNKNILKMLKQETGIFYFGYSSCPWCRNVVESLVEVAVENDLPIYYIDSKHLEKETSEQIINYLSYYLRETDGKKRLYVPDVYFVKKGQIIDHHIGSIDEQTNPFEKLTGKDKEKLKKIYLDYIKEMS